MASGLFVYSGEPHMVLIQPDAASSFAWPPALDWEWTLPDLFADAAFANGADGANPLAAIGMHANRPGGRDFPLGINVSAARMVDGGRTIEYRTFERGILRETLACGTGALAVAVAARRLGLVGGERVSLIPALGRRHPRYRGAEIVVRHRDDGTSSLSSKAEHVFSGTLPE
jgi:diaminopimelate epimerase